MPLTGRPAPDAGIHPYARRRWTLYGPYLQNCTPNEQVCNSVSHCAPSVGAPGFEPGTSCSQSRRATELRHAPKLFIYIVLERYTDVIQIQTVPITLVFWALQMSCRQDNRGARFQGDATSLRRQPGAWDLAGLLPWRTWRPANARPILASMSD